MRGLAARCALVHYLGKGSNGKNLPINCGWRREEAGKSLLHTSGTCRIGNMPPSSGDNRTDLQALNGANFLNYLRNLSIRNLVATYTRQHQSSQVHKLRRLKRALPRKK